MPAIIKTKKTLSSFKSVLSAAKRLTDEEKQVLRLKLFSSDALAEMKLFEAGLKKKKSLMKKSDEEVVKLTTSKRRKE